MTSTGQTVFVFGAGFTRAFVPDSPVMNDHWNLSNIQRSIQGLSFARNIIKSQRKSDGRVDIERLMTRLHNGMPYDADIFIDKEVAFLYPQVKNCLSDRIETAKKGEIFRDDLNALAEYCVNNNITCITFNYDDVFDEALYSRTKSKGIYWSPDQGYGFFCKPSASCVWDAEYFADKTAMELLKLHGSINWYPKRGYSHPYALETIVHHERWFRYPSPTEYPMDLIERLLEKTPFIVPPVLEKSALLEQPILRLIWTRAYEALMKAEEIIFIGYSLSAADSAAHFLFRETIKKRTRIKVVNHINNIEEQKVLRNAYQYVFTRRKNIQFEFMDAREWSREVIRKSKIKQV